MILRGTFYPAMQPILIPNLVTIVLAFLAALTLACSVSSRRRFDESAQAASSGWSREHAPTAISNVLLFRVGLTLLLLAFVSQASSGSLQERIEASTRGLATGQSEDSVVRQPLSQPEDEHAVAGVERIVEEFREPRSETRAYFTHVSIAVRVPYPKDWIAYVERNDDNEFRIRFYPREPEAIGYTLQRSRRARNPCMESVMRMWRKSGGRGYPWSAFVFHHFGILSMNHRHRLRGGSITYGTTKRGSISSAAKRAIHFLRRQSCC